MIHMTHKRNAFYFGLFVLFALGLFLVLLLSIGGRGMFTKQARYTLYFNKSVKGLSAGSPIMFRGVRIGQVRTIQFSNPQTAEDGTVYWPIEVGVDIDPLSLDIGKNEDFSNNSLMATTTRDSLLIFKGQEMVDKWLDIMVCRHGLCAQLQSLSFLTGQLFIELDFFEDDGVTASERENLKKGVIPTRISAFEKMYLSLSRKEQTSVMNDALMQISQFISSGKAQKTMDNLYDTSENVKAITGNARGLMEDFTGSSKDTAFSVMAVLGQAHTALMNANKFMDAVNADAPEILGDAKSAAKNLNDRIDKIGGQAEELVQELQKLTVRINDLVNTDDGPASKLLGDVNRLTTQANGTFSELQKTFALLQQYMAPDSPERQVLQHTLEQVERAATSIRNLSDTIQRNPEALLWGK